jgi:hypothetical protein
VGHIAGQPDEAARAHLHAFATDDDGDVPFEHQQGRVLVTVHVQRRGEAFGSALLHDAERAGGVVAVGEHPQERPEEPAVPECRLGHGGGHGRSLLRAIDRVLLY